MTDKTISQPENCGLNRRDFLKFSAITGSAAAFLGLLPKVQTVLAGDSAAQSYALAQAENQLYTVCLQCNTGCAIKVKLLDGVAAKIDGNPYSPWTLWPHPAYEMNFPLSMMVIWAFGSLLRALAAAFGPQATPPITMILKGLSLILSWTPFLNVQ